MTKQERTQLRNRIIAALSETDETIRQLEEATRPIAPENAIGRISRMDAIHNKSVAEASLRTAQRKRNSLKTALNKIDEPDFGICARCGNPIPSARLMFMPQSIYCVRCADR